MNTKLLLAHEEEVRKAQADFPGLDITDAYTRYKKARGDTPTFLSSADQTALTRQIDQFTKRACPVKKCSGTMHLESVCPSCVEGKAGFQSKWTCDKCMFRRLSKLDFSDWFKIPPGTDEIYPP